MQYTWNSAFEAVPADTDDIMYGAGDIRSFKVAVRERLMVQHDFENTGNHLPGQCSILFEGTAAQINALTGLTDGCFAFNTDTGSFMRYSGTLSAWVPISSILTVAAGGTANVITATFSPPLTALSDQMRVCVIAAYANTNVVGGNPAVPTFQLLGAVSPPAAANIVKGNNQPIAIGDIPGAGYPCILEYSTSYGAWILLNPASPVTAIPVSFGGLYSNLVITVTGVTAVNLTARYLLLQASGGLIQIGPNINVTVNTGVSGANGLDAGSLAASTWYYLWVIYNPTTQTYAGLISLSSTAPTLPTGYTYASRFGAVVTDSNKHLLYTLQVGNRVRYITGTNPTTPLVMSSGTQGSVDIPTWVGVAVGSFVPPTAEIITIYGYGVTVIVAPNNTYGGRIQTGTAPNLNNPPPLCVNVVGIGSILEDIVLESSNIYWASINYQGYLICAGWIDNL
jgi:hypothetical protein